jgi:hypothetical protein
MGSEADISFFTGIPFLSAPESAVEAELSAADLIDAHETSIKDKTHAAGTTAFFTSFMF